LVVENLNFDLLFDFIQDLRIDMALLDCS